MADISDEPLSTMKISTETSTATTTTTSSSPSILEGLVDESASSTNLSTGLTPPKSPVAPRTGLKRKNSDSNDDSGYSDYDSGSSSDDSNSSLSESAPNSPSESLTGGPPRPSHAYSEQRRLVFNMSMCK